jgi:hypothetical protein
LRVVTAPGYRGSHMYQRIGHVHHHHPQRVG